MFGSLYIGLSGMRAYSDGLRQVSNNISNLNSSGFKTSDLVFRDLFGGRTAGSGLTAGQSGGGQGVSLAELRLDFKPGELRQTDNSLDLAVNGAGFLVLEKGGAYTYARTGSFEIDKDGFIRLSGTDYRLTVINGSGKPEALNIDPLRMSQPQATTRIKFADNLSSTATEHTLADIKVYDPLGNADNWQVKFTRSETDPAGEWIVTVTSGGDAEIGTHTLNFIGGMARQDTAKFTVTDGDRSVEFDFSENVTSFSSGSISTLRSAEVDGRATGEIVSIGVNDDGEIEITYTNEEKDAAGAVTLADFQDPQSLTQLSGGLFSHDGARGVQFLTSRHERVGKVMSFRSEASNVDLSAQFGDLILIQRGYQASSQLVSVSNEMIQQLFGLRGQG